MKLEKEIKGLAKDTIYYGMSNIIPKFLNWILVYLYTRIFNEVEYGIITELYTYASIINVILTFGLETALFRFGSKANEKELKNIYSNVFLLVLTISGTFLIITILFLNNISVILKYEEKESYILILSLILFVDAISAIPFSLLRLRNKVKKFAIIKILNILLYIFLNIAAVYIIPKINIDVIQKNYKINVGIILFANLIASIFNLILLYKEISIVEIKISKKTIKSILVYAIPLLITQLSGILNDGIDRVLLKVMIKDTEKALYFLGIYGANIKIALIIVLFTQAFRYAYEPFVFNKSKDVNSKETYAEVMKIYVYVTSLFYLIVNMYINLFKYIEGEKFWVGLNVVPIVMISYILSGIAFNLSIWYKLIDKTFYGIIITISGIIIKIIINVIFIEKYNYLACAWSNLFSYLTMIIISYTLEKKHYRIDYDLKSIVQNIIIVIILIMSINFIEKNLNNKFMIEVIKPIFIVIYLIYMNKKLKIYENKNS